MGEDDVRRVVAELEGRFQAALRAEEDAAADDLAFSLGHDIPARSEILRRGGLLLVEHAEIPIATVAHDYLGAGPWLVPLDRAVVALGGAAPMAEADVLIGRLRRWSRDGAVVEVGLGSGRQLRGTLVVAGASHLVLDGPRRLVVPLCRVDQIRRVPEGSADRLDDERARDRDLGSCKGSSDRDRVLGAWECVRERRLLMRRDERGSVLVDTTFSLFVLMFIVVGVIQVALTLYARNVVATAAHDGARAAIEVAGSSADAEKAAERVISASAGSLVDDVEVEASIRDIGSRQIARVVASARISVVGPLPFGIPITVDASASRENFDR